MSDVHHDSGSEQSFDQEIRFDQLRRFGVGLLLVTIASMAVTWWLVVGSRDAERAQDPEPSPLAKASKPWEPPSPQLQEFPPTVDIKAFRAWEEDRLHNFAQVEEAGGIVRIPIDQAIHILAERGFPERGDVEALADEVFGRAGRGGR